MDTRFLQSFVTVAEHGSLAEAARRLHLTPGAVSQRVRALEVELGTPLIRRSGRTVTPTEGGAAILEGARQLLREVRHLKVAAERPAATGELRIGAIPSTLTGFLPDILRDFTTGHPEVEVYVEPGKSLALYGSVLAGELDAAVLIQPSFAIPKTCTFAVLRDEPLIVVAPASAATHDPLALLASEPFIRYDRNHWGGRLADEYLREQGIRPSERVELDALDAIAVMVDRGLGVSLVPDWPSPFFEHLSLRKLALPEPVPVRRVGVQWRPDSPRITRIDAFVAACRASQLSRPAASPDERRGGAMRTC